MSSAFDGMRSTCKMFIVALATALLLALTGCGSTQEPAEAEAETAVEVDSDVETDQVSDDQYYVACVDPDGNYGDFAECEQFDDFDDADDYEEHVGRTTANGFVLGLVAASLLNGNRPVVGQPAHSSLLRTMPANATLITPSGVVMPPGYGESSKNHVTKKPAAKDSPAKKSVTKSVKKPAKKAATKRGKKR